MCTDALTRRCSSTRDAFFDYASLRRVTAATDDLNYLSRSVGGMRSDSEADVRVT